MNFITPEEARARRNEAVAKEEAKYEKDLEKLHKYVNQQIIKAADEKHLDVTINEPNSYLRKTIKKELVLTGYTVEEEGFDLKIDFKE